MKIHIFSQKTNIIFCGIVFPAGTIYEPPHLKGISHFVEHMIFTSSHFFEVEQNGFIADAITYPDFMIIYLYGPPEISHFRSALNAFASALCADAYFHDAFETVKKTILSEIYETNSNPSKLIYDLLFYNTFHEVPVYGTTDTVSAITLEDCIIFKKYLFSQKNINVILYGDVGRKHINITRDIITRVFTGNTILSRFQSPLKKNIQIDFDLNCGDVCFIAATSPCQRADFPSAVFTESVLTIGSENPVTEIFLQKYGLGDTAELVVNYLEHLAAPCVVLHNIPKKQVKVIDKAVRDFAERIDEICDNADALEYRKKLFCSSVYSQNLEYKITILARYIMDGFCPRSFSEMIEHFCSAEPLVFLPEKIRKICIF